MKKSSEKEKIILTKDKCLSNWDTPLFINYPYKDFVSFIKKQFITKDVDLLILLRLYKEICIMLKDDSQNGFNIFLSDDSFEKITTEDILYLLQNIKRLLYLMLDEIKQENILGNKYIYNSITKENALLAFIKKNFSIFISLFKNGGFNDINKIKNEKELDQKFSNIFGLNNNINDYLENNDDNELKNENKMEIEEEEEKINNNLKNNIINNKDYSNEIKTEIINIYNFIISTYNDLEKPNEDIISFTHLLIKNLVNNVNQNGSNDLLIKIKKSLSLLLGMYINIFKSNKKIICHPIRTIFQEIVNYLIKILLNTEIKEDSKNELDNYYKYLLSIYNILSKEKKEKILIDFQNSILYYSKQIIYENVDSADFKNPMEIKNINLNDIDKKILFHRYIIDILFFLDEEYAKAFFGFYLRFFLMSEKNELLCCNENIVKCLKYFIKIKWLPQQFVELVIIANNKNTKYNKIKKIIEFVFHYLRTYKMLPENTTREIESKKRACAKLKYLYKNIILENINALS